MAASDLGLHCLHIFHKKDARLIWIGHSCAITQCFHLLSTCLTTIFRTRRWVGLRSVIVKFPSHTHLLLQCMLLGGYIDARCALLSRLYD